MQRTIAGALLVFGCLQQVQAEMYKCRDERGGVIYQQSPCPDGEGHAMKIYDNNVGGEIRDTEKDWLYRRESEESLIRAERGERNEAERQARQRRIEEKKQACSSARADMDEYNDRANTLHGLNAYYRTKAEETKDWIRHNCP